MYQTAVRFCTVSHCVIIKSVLSEKGGALDACDFDMWSVHANSKSKLTSKQIIHDPVTDHLKTRKDIFLILRQAETHSAVVGTAGTSWHPAPPPPTYPMTHVTDTFPELHSQFTDYLIFNNCTTVRNSSNVLYI